MTETKRQGRRIAKVTEPFWDRARRLAETVARLQEEAAADEPEAVSLDDVLGGPDEPARLETAEERPRQRRRGERKRLLTAQAASSGWAARWGGGRRGSD